MTTYEVKQIDAHTKVSVPVEVEPKAPEPKQEKVKDDGKPKAAK